MNRKRRLPTPSTSTEHGSSSGRFVRQDISVGAAAEIDRVKAAADELFNGGGTTMALCSCFSHISLNRDPLVEAWLENRPWHVEETERRRCNDGHKECALVLVRSIFQYVVALENKLLKQLLTSLSTVVLPEVCRRTYEGGNNDQEGFEKMLKLLEACSEPLESRAQIASILAQRLRLCLLSLVEVAEIGDGDLAAELRGLLAGLESSDVLSRDSIETQRYLLNRMVTETWKCRRRREAMECAYLG